MLVVAFLGGLVCSVGLVYFLAKLEKDIPSFLQTYQKRVVKEAYTLQPESLTFVDGYVEVRSRLGDLEFVLAKPIFDELFVRVEGLEQGSDK